MNLAACGGTFLTGLTGLTRFSLYLPAGRQVLNIPGPDLVLQGRRTRLQSGYFIAAQVDCMQVAPIIVPYDIPLKNIQDMAYGTSEITTYGIFKMTYGVIRAGHYSKCKARIQTSINSFKIWPAILVRRCLWRIIRASLPARACLYRQNYLD